VSPLVGCCVAAFVLSLVGTGVARRVAIRRGRLDEPDPTRRIHTRPTPRVGGLGIAAGFFTSLLALAVVYAERSPIRAAAATSDRAVLVGAALFFALGWLDDVRRLPAGLKGLLQIGAAVVPVAALGLRFEGVPDGPWPAIDLGSLSIPMTVLWILAVVNVVNFLDGIDLITSLTVLVPLCAGAALEPEIGAPAIAVGAVVGFVPWNVPPARVFMGDAGSHLLGFVVAALPCGVFTPTTSDETEFVAFLAGPSFGVPWPLVAAPLLPAILDVLEALIHKARVGVPMSQAHADHLYQRLVKAGWPAWLVAIRYGSLSLSGVLLAGPVAARWGLAAAIVPGVFLLVVHWVTGVRATRHVPRLQRT
jgi:UDP-GlcNAc:undecaprenyl-phosphate/decaprenyl-phosphate GlcNAc-1-phosphate transferase